MRVEKNVLISIEASDVKNGLLKLPKSVKKIADKAVTYNDNIVKVIAPALEEIGNDNFRYCNALTQFDAPVLTSMGNDNFRYCNALTQFDAPVLTSMGNDNFRECNALTQFDAPVLTSMGSYNFRICNALNSLKLGNRELTVKIVDNTIFVIQNAKTTKGIILYAGYVLNSIYENKINKTDCFIAEKDGFFAHGTDVKKAISDVQFKIVSEKLKKEPIKADTMISVNYYRLITGACEMGCKEFIQRNNLEKNEYRADELLPILEKNHAYGIEKFKRLVDF